MTLVSFFQVIVRNIAQSMELLTEKMEDIKIKDDIFLGNDLSFEQKFLNHIVNKCSKGIENYKVSFHFSKKSMTICCKTSIMTKTIAKSLLDIVDLIMKQHFFFCTNGLRQLGWCARYMLDRRSLNYCGLRKSSQTNELTGFYWFNNLLNRSFKQKTATQVEICNCFHCLFFVKEK